MVELDRSVLVRRLRTVVAAALAAAFARFVGTGAFEDSLAVGVYAALGVGAVMLLFTLVMDGTDSVVGSLLS